MKQILALVSLLILAAACTPSAPPTPISGNQGTSPNPAQAPTVGSLPVFRHVYLIVLENKEYDSIVGAEQVPFINTLINRYGLATNYTGVAHPSLPNYLALFSGSTHGVTENNYPTINAPNLADQLEAHGKTWRLYAENIPLNCFKGDTASGGPDGEGTYVRKHNPAIHFADILDSPGRCKNISDFAHFDPNAADFEMIVPNLCNQAHDCPISTSDSFLEHFISRLVGGASWQEDDVLFITFDEGKTDDGAGGRVPTIVVSNHMSAGAKSDVAHNHYSLLRTIEDSWGLGCLAETCSANNLSEFFKQQ